MTNFLDSVNENTKKALANLNSWKEEESAAKVYRRYLSSEGAKYKGKSKLSELQDECHEMALNAEDPTIRLKAIQLSLSMAAGTEKAATNINTQINLGDFLDKLPIKESL